MTEGESDQVEVRDEAKGKGDHAQKMLQCFYRGGAGLIGDGSYLWSVHTDSIAKNDEAEKTEAGISPLTLLPLELQVMLSYASEDFSESL